MRQTIARTTTAAAVALTFAASARPAHASLPVAFPDQAGDATAYVTPNGTPAHVVYAYLGGHDNAHYARIVVPDQLAPDRPTPTVMVLHGATNTEDTITGTAMARVVDAWLDAGWPVVSTREGSTVSMNRAGTVVGVGTWGNEWSRRGMVDQWRALPWATDPHGMLLYGISMGGGAAFNLAAEAQAQGVPVAAVYSVDGATSLAYQATVNAAQRKKIDAAYGLPGSTLPGSPAWQAAVNVADGGHDPNVMAPALTPFPVRLSASASDSTVQRAGNSWPLAAALTAAGWPAVSTRATTGGHCAASHFSAADAMAFYRAALA